MIQAILQAEGDTHLGKKLVLRSGQSATVGRTDWADLCVGNDQTISDFEFELVCESTHCKITSCNFLTPVLVNGKAVISANLRDGDRIQAGSTTFHFELPNQRFTPRGQDSRDEREMTCDEGWTAHIEMSDKAHELADATTDPMQLIQILREHELFSDAISVLAQLLSKPESVVWAAGCVRDVNTELVDADQKALSAAEEWANEPSESKRQAAAVAAQQETEHDSPSASRWLALSAFWSSGNIAQEVDKFIVPDETLTNQAIKFGLMSAARETHRGNWEARLNEFISRGLNQITATPESACGR